MFEKRDIFKDFNRAEQIKRQEERERLRVETLDQRRRTENAAIIQAQGEGCFFCIDGAKSVKECDQIDICREKYVYLPIYMDVRNQRPTWCPGFEQNGDGLPANPSSHEQHEQSTYAEATADRHETEHQEELPL